MPVLTLLLRLLRPQRRRIALLALVILGATIVVMMFPALVLALFKLLSKEPVAVPGRLADHPFFVHLARRINDLLAGPSKVRLRALGFIAFAVFVIALLRSLLSYSRAYLGQYIGGRALIDLRTSLFERLQHLSLSFYESQRVGDLMSRLTTDVGLVQQLVTEDMTNYVMAPLVVLVGLAFMLALNWQLTLMVVVFAPVMGYVVSRTGRRMRRLTRSQQERVGDLNARLHERLAAMRVIQSFAREQHEIDIFRNLNERTFEAAVRVAKVNALSPQVIQLLTIIPFVIVTTYAGSLIIANQLKLSSLMAYFALVQQVGVYFVKFGTLHLRVQQSLAALGRITEIMGREPDIRDSPNAESLVHVAGQITFREVAFWYADGEEVLHDISLDIAPGEMVALVGPSGAGKTSLANLLLRFYDPTAGSVQIDGHDLRTVTLHSLRSQIGLVPQETILFGGTIKDNILYGRAEATEEEVVAAAKAANAHDFIMALPNGYETEVGERGVKLSGGQRQRIAVARALLKNPRILILDEATSSLDTESEALVQEALERLMKERTTLVIAHRLSTIRRADRILVLSDGRIVEQGRHAELLAAGGLYSRLYGVQQELVAGASGSYPGRAEAIAGDESPGTSPE
jgi:subfamily B ATP-binding cassette protein MsbA